VNSHFNIEGSYCIWILIPRSFKSLWRRHRFWNENRKQWLHNDLVCYSGLSLWSNM